MHASSEEAESRPQGWNTFSPQGQARDNQCVIRLIWTWNLLPEGSLQLLLGAVSESALSSGDKTGV